MPDNVTLSNGDLATVEVAADEVQVSGTPGVAKVQFNKLVDGANGGTQPIGGDSANGLDVDVTRVQGTVNVADGGGSLTVDGTVGVSGTVTVDSELTTADLDTGAGTDTRAVVGLALAASGGALLVGATNPVPVSDSGSTLSVDDNGGTLTVDDGGGSLTVDGTVGITGTVTVDTELTTADFDSAAGTSNAAVTGLIVPASGGPVIVQGDVANGLDVDVTRLPALPAGSATIGNVGLAPRTSGGSTPFKTTSLVNAAQAVKATAGQLYGWYLFNAHTSTLYVKVYNLPAGSVVMGTTTPTLTLPIPAGGAANLELVNGIDLAGSGIAVACTGGAGDSDNTAVSANLLIANLFYK